MTGPTAYLTHLLHQRLVDLDHSNLRGERAGREEARKQLLLAARGHGLLIAHQAGGLGNPFDRNSSTLLTHFDAFRSGVERGDF